MRQIVSDCPRFNTQRIGPCVKSNLHLLDAHSLDRRTLDLAWKSQKESAAPGQIANVGRIVVMLELENAC